MDFQGVGSVVATLKLSFNEACGVLAPRPGIDPEFPALQEGFLTTGPPEVPFSLCVCVCVCIRFFGLWLLRGFLKYSSLYICDYFNLLIS